MSDQTKRSLETDGKEEDWEVISGLKSLSLEPKDTVENTGNEGIDNNQDKEEICEEVVQEEDPILNKDVQNEDVADEPEDWYKNLPTTPMNTPEYAPGTPTYPSSNRMLEMELENLELAPITEEPSEDNLTGEKTPEEKHEDTQIPDSDLLQKSLEIIKYTLTRLAILIVGFGIIKWSVRKASEYLKKLKQSRSKTNTNEE